MYEKINLSAYVWIVGEAHLALEFLVAALGLTLAGDDLVAVLPALRARAARGHLRRAILGDRAHGCRVAGCHTSDLRSGASVKLWWQTIRTNGLE